MPEMSPEAINEAVARKLGWKYVNKYPPIGPFDGESGVAPGSEKGGDGKYTYQTIPDYCHSIAAAWEVVEKVKWYTMWRDEQGFHFFIRSGPNPDNEIAAAYADTATMAICLAFLKLEPAAKEAAC